MSSSPQHNENSKFLPLQQPSSHLLSSYISLYTSSPSPHPIPASHIPNLLALYRYYESEAERLVVARRKWRQFEVNHGVVGSESATRLQQRSDVMLDESIDLSVTLPLLMQQGTASPDPAHNIAKILHILKFLIKKTLEAHHQPTPLDNLVSHMKKHMGMEDDGATKWHNIILNLEAPKHSGAVDAQNFTTHSMEGAPREGGVMGADLRIGGNVLHHRVTQKFSEHVRPQFDYDLYEAWGAFETLIQNFICDSRGAGLLTTFPLESFLNRWVCIRDEWSELIRIRLFVEDMYWRLGGHPLLLDAYNAWMRFMRRCNTVEQFLPLACRPFHVLCENVAHLAHPFMETRTSALLESLREVLFALSALLCKKSREWTVEDRRSVWMYLRSYPQILLASWLLVHTDYRTTPNSGEDEWTNLADMIAFLTCMDPTVLCSEPKRLIPRAMSQALSAQVFPVLQTPTRLDSSSPAVKNMGTSLFIRLQVLLIHSTIIYPNSKFLQHVISAALKRASTTEHTLEIAKQICEYFSILNVSEKESLLLSAKHGLTYLEDKVQRLCKKERVRYLIPDRLEAISRGEMIVYSPEIHHAVEEVLEE